MAPSNGSSGLVFNEEGKKNPVSWEKSYVHVTPGFSEALLPHVGSQAEGKADYEGGQRDNSFVQKHR